MRRIFQPAILFQSLAAMFGIQRQTEHAIAPMFEGDDFSHDRADDTYGRKRGHKTKSILKRRRRYQISFKSRRRNRTTAF